MSGDSARIHQVGLAVTKALYTKKSQDISADQWTSSDGTLEVNSGTLRIPYGIPDGTFTGWGLHPTNYVGPSGQYGGNRYVAESVTPTASKYLVNVQLYYSKQGAPGALTVEIRSDNAGVPSTTILASATYAGGVGAITVPFAVPPFLTSGTRYWIVTYSSSGATDTSAKNWSFYYNTGSTAGYTSSTNLFLLSSDGVTWGADNTGMDFVVKFNYGTSPLTGTATKAINTLDVVNSWDSLSFTSTMNGTGGTVKINVQDLAGNTLKSNVASGGTLADIDPHLYPVIQLQAVITRTAVAQTSSTLNSATVNWSASPLSPNYVADQITAPTIGLPGIANTIYSPIYRYNWVNIASGTYTVVSFTGSGYVTYLELFLPSGANDYVDIIVDGVATRFTYAGTGNQTFKYFGSQFQTSIKPNEHYGVIRVEKSFQVVMVSSTSSSGTYFNTVFANDH